MKYECQGDVVAVTPVKRSDYISNPIAAGKQIIVVDDGSITTQTGKKVDRVNFGRVLGVGAGVLLQSGVLWKFPIEVGEIIAYSATPMDILEEFTDEGVRIQLVKANKVLLGKIQK